MVEKIKYWWSDDGKWFCILVNDGVDQATVSLTRAEARALAANINDPARPPDNSVCNCGAMTATADWRGVHSPACKALDL
jgi:hypothetical protein